MVGGKRLRKVLLPCLADSGNQLRVSLRVSVMGVPRLCVEVCLFNDGFVSGKVGIADGKIDDIAVF